MCIHIKLFKFSVGFITLIVRIAYMSVVKAVTSCYNLIEKTLDLCNKIAVYYSVRERESFLKEGSRQ